MTFTEACDLSRRIKSARSDVLAKAHGQVNGWCVIVKRKYRKGPGWAPITLGPPHFLDSWEDWLALSGQI